MRQRVRSLRARPLVNPAASADAATPSSRCPDSSTCAPTARSLLVVALVAACGPWPCLALGGGAGPVVRCEPCDGRALSQCEQLTGCELVREPGCGCCLTCALREGALCGIYTERCGSGLKCQPQAGEERQLQAMLEGRGVCRHYEAELEHRDESSFAEATESPEPAPPPARSRHGAVPSNKRKQERLRLVGDNALVNAHAQENKPDGDTGPCKRSMELAIKRLKESTNLVPKSIYIPNCDRRGYYKKKQCNPSKGRKRGLCWCVDKYGARVPGSEHMGGGTRCQSLMERD